MNPYKSFGADLNDSNSESLFKSEKKETRSDEDPNFEQKIAEKGKSLTNVSVEYKTK